MSEAIARHSGRAFVPLEEVATAEQLLGLREEAARLSAGEVLDLAREELASLIPG